VRVKRTQRGFSMLEVLIALLVLVLGMMSVSMLVLKALSNGREAYLRGQAALLADEISDAMRANPVYNASQNPGWDHYIETHYSEHNSGLVKACNASASCSQPELAAFDLARWKQDIASSTLPNAQAIVCWDGSPESQSATLSNPQCAGGAASMVAVKIVWAYKSNTAGYQSASATGRYVLRFDPRGAN